MSMFDYVNGITIGSIAAEFATSLEDDYWMPLTAMVVYGVTAALISYITCKSMAARKFINGKPLSCMKTESFTKKTWLRPSWTSMSS